METERHLRQVYPYLMLFGIPLAAVFVGIQFDDVMTRYAVAAGIAIGGTVAAFQAQRRLYSDAD